MSIQTAAQSITKWLLTAVKAWGERSRLRSGATAGEGNQNMLCAYLAAGVLAGLVLNTAFGLWWADPTVALVIAALAIHEGRETWRGEGCCTGTTAPVPDDDCCA